MSRRKHSHRPAHTPRIRKTSHSAAGPEVWNAPPGAAATRIHAMIYQDESFTEESVADAPQLEHLLRELGVKWIHLSGFADVSLVNQLATQFQIHPLAMEDVVSTHQRAKVEEYPEHLFIVIRTVFLEEDRVHTEQLSIFLGKGYVLTFQAHEHGELELVREKLRRTRGIIRQSGADYLVYSILDTIIDSYFPVVDNYGERMEDLDEGLTRNREANFMSELHSLRGDLMLLRRAIRPLRDSILRLMPDTWSHIRPETQIYLRDCYDHTVQLMDLLDTYRELASDLRDYYMSMVSNRMNEIVKVLTIISTIFIPLSFVTGIYGMNFNTDHQSNMPELNWPYGYAFALSLMGCVALTQLYFFWRKGWLS